MLASTMEWGQTPLPYWHVQVRLVIWVKLKQLANFESLCTFSAGPV
jgi:hypothetical protein